MQKCIQVKDLCLNFGIVHKDIIDVDAFQSGVWVTSLKKQFHSHRGLGSCEILQTLGNSRCFPLYVKFDLIHSDL